VYTDLGFPRIVWPNMTVVEGFEQKLSSYLRGWLGLPCSLSSIGLYGNSSSSWHGHRNTYSKQDRVSGVGITMRMGRKWRAVEAVQQAEARLKQKVLLRSVPHGRARHRPDMTLPVGRRRYGGQEEVRASVEEEGASRKWQCDSRVPG